MLSHSFPSTMHFQNLGESRRWQTAWRICCLTAKTRAGVTCSPCRYCSLSWEDVKSTPTLHSSFHFLLVCGNFLDTKFASGSHHPLAPPKDIAEALEGSAACCRCQGCQVWSRFRQWWPPKWDTGALPISGAFSVFSIQSYPNIILAFRAEIDHGAIRTQQICGCSPAHFSCWIEAWSHMEIRPTLLPYFWAIALGCPKIGFNVILDTVSTERFRGLKTMNFLQLFYSFFLIIEDEDGWGNRSLWSLKQKTAT